MPRHATLAASPHSPPGPTRFPLSFISLPCPQVSDKVKDLYIPWGALHASDEIGRGGFSTVYKGTYLVGLGSGGLGCQGLTLNPVQGHLPGGTGGFGGLRD